MTSLERVELVMFAAVFLLAGVAMVFYERARIAAGRPILAGRDTVQVYWVAYLTCFVLTLVIAVKLIVTL
jgi:hypothetical protein